MTRQKPSPLSILHPRHNLQHAWVMNSCFYRLPTNLSDQVIGPVIQRKKFSYNEFLDISSREEAPINVNDCLADQKDSVSTTLDTAVAALKDAQGIFLRALHRAGQTRYGKSNSDLLTSLEEDVRQLQGSRVLNEALARLITGTKNNDTMSALKEAQTMFIRALRRVRQILYRRKKRDQFVVLQDAIVELKRDINKMEQGRRSLIAAIPPKENVWSIALEYFRIFHYGLPATSQFMTYSTMEPCAQLDFVQNSMAPDVVFNGERGPEAVIKSWGCLSHWFKDISVDLDRLTKGPAGSVIASTVTTVTITEQTLRQVFPRLWMLDGRGGCLVSTLVNKLRGQRLVMRGSTHFEWDGGYGRVICVRTMADMLTPLLELLGNVEDVARVFNEALITPEFQLRSIE